MSVETPYIYPRLPDTAPASNKKSRQSLSSLPTSHGAYNSNNDEHTVQFPLKHSISVQDGKDGARRKRAASVGGAGDAAGLKVEELSPRRLSRRMAVSEPCARRNASI